ncbi:pyridoxal phosphate-dependent aminotransferase [Streptomyces rugosispiralis]|uniref:Aminotransferase class I/II-fold pyridoxal phosphate-dependent enzyme n=1 Tax=Streptomyces rugosispiralis TaxID=2967341 RepID=A0ABT1V069_9ACTN|nr:aminotransferase class I/II-fold pyridoxal phosphate-dependent enzyme [Streptomyces rugosispiralis]MCQ8190774.1 aminotransferase class I/II-fold pyridoxal phosphate-dependent enzyme [Streptomyces rugosispiralis]
MELFRGTAHSPSFFALNRAGVTGGGQELVDFCIPCNPYFPTPAMFAVMAVRLRDILTYYPSSAETITAELADVLGLQPQTMAMGNGSTELITWIDHLLVKESLAVPIPTFGRWTDQPMETGKRVDMFQLPEMSGFALDPNAFVNFVRSRGSRVAVICNPNNPDGGLVPRQALIGIMDALADLDLIVIDESFLEFADAEAYPSVVDEAILRPNVIVLRSLGKNFGLHGVRFGYLVANPSLAVQIRSRLPKWNLNSFAEVIVFMLKRYRQEYVESLRMLSRDRQQMTTQLAGLPGMTVYPSQGNFVFVKLPAGTDGSWIRDQLLSQHGVLVRECGNKLGSSSQFMRLVVRSQPDVQRLLTGLSTVLYGTSFYAPQVSWDQQPSLPSGYAQPSGSMEALGVTGQAQSLDYSYQQPPQLPAAPVAQEPQPMYSAAALPVPQGVSGDPYGQASFAGAGAGASPGYVQQQQPLPELSPAYVATPPAQPPLYQAPAALPQPQMVQAPQPQIPQQAPAQQFPAQQLQPAQNLAPQGQAPLMQMAPQPQGAQYQGAQAQTSQMPMVQAQGAQGQGTAAYAQARPEETTVDQIPVYGQRNAGIPEPSPMERTQAMTYDPAELKAAAAAAAPMVPLSEQDDDPTGQTPALQRYPRPAAYLQDDSTA